MNIQDLHYVAKLKHLGWDDAKIADKMGTTVEKLDREWKQAIAHSERLLTSGYADLCEQFRTLCGQYELLGESLKIISGALGNSVTPDELIKVVGSEELANKLIGSYIILRPFASVNPQVSLEKVIASN